MADEGPVLVKMLGATLSKNLERLLNACAGGKPGGLRFF